MSALGSLCDKFPESAKDIKLNLQAVLQSNVLSAQQRWGVAIACAVNTKNRELAEAVLFDAKQEVTAATIDDGQAAAVMMAMNNVYYRFRHLIGKQSYSLKPARLRMNRMVKPATNRMDFELFSMAVSAMNGCESCLRAHEKVLIEGGLTEDQIHDAVRIGATIQASSVALDLLETASPLQSSQPTSVSTEVLKENQHV
jgi:lipoyl-dependent peroxiredoxin subunit D